MASQITNTLVNNDRKFAVNFDITNYSSDVNSFPTLDIWKDITINLRQEEKFNSSLYFYHEVKRNDSLESISNFYYQTINLWWLILLVNECEDPFDFLQEKLNTAAPIKILKVQFLGNILKSNTTNDILKYLKER